jgi:hypothetical protein
MLRKISQTQKQKDCVISLIWGIYFLKIKYAEIVNKTVVISTRGDEKIEIRG